MSSCSPERDGYDHIDVRNDSPGQWLARAAIMLSIAVSLCAGSLRAQGPSAGPSTGSSAAPAQAAASARCVMLELYIRLNDAQAKASVDAIREYAAERRGLHLKTYDVDHDAAGLSRLKMIASAYKLGEPQLPLVYGLNATASSIATRQEWRGRLRELLRMEVFTRKGCPRCAKAKEYLPSFTKKYPGIQVQVYEVLSDPQSNQRFADLAARHRIGGVSYPGFWVGQHLVIGFDNEKDTAGRLDQILARWTFECKLAAAGERAGRTSSAERFAMRSRSQPMQWIGPIADHITLAARTIDATSAAPQDEADSSVPSLPIIGEEAGDQVLEPSESSLPLPGETEQEAYSEGEDDSQAMEIPWLGRLSAKELGMPLFTLAIGLIDGFNPCAMWVLLFLLSVLVNLQDRWKILAVAGTFVVISGLAYFAFMAAWLNVLLLVGFLRSVQIALAALAIFVGVVHIKDYFAFKKGISLSIPESAKPRIYEQVRRVVTAQNLTAAIIGAVVLAVLVNIIELLCTAGLPALYTQVLSQQGYASWKHYAYLGLYILAYMFDDMVMLSIVVITLGRHKLQETEGRWLKLVSGLVILGLGVVLLLKPEWLE